MNFDYEHSITIMRVKLESFYWSFWGLPFTLNPKLMLKWVFLCSYSEVKFTEFLQECQLTSRGFQKWLLLAIIHSMRLTKKFGLRQRHKIQFRLEPCSSESKCFLVSDFTWMCDASRKVDRTPWDDTVERAIARRDMMQSKGRSHVCTMQLKRSIARRCMMQVEKPLPSPSQPSKCLRSQSLSIWVGFTHSCILFWNWYHFLRVLRPRLTPLLLKATLAWPVNPNKKVIANKNLW
jgi:hypothetical protein